MDNTLKILLLIFIILGGAGYYYTKQSKKEKTTLKAGDWDMAIKNPDDIYHIFIADRVTNETIDLVRKGDEWTYNNKWKARPNAIENLLMMMRTVQLRERPANAAIPHMVKSLATQGVKVEIYDKNGEALKKYYVGGTTPDERGTYMILENSNNPYVMHMQHAEGSLRGLFFMGEKNWRDKEVFAFTIDEVKSISLDYPRNKNQSFKLSKNEKDWSLDPLYPSTRIINRRLDIDAIEEFIGGFKSLGAEAFENDFEKRDSVIASQPFCTIKIEKQNGDEKVAILHPLDFKFKDPKADKESTYYERYLADMQNEDRDLMLIQHIVFKKIFWGYPFFFMPEKKSIRG